MSQLALLIEVALKDPDNVKRSQAEARIVDSRNRNPVQFLLACASLIQSQSSSDFIRQSTCTVVSRLSVQLDNSGNNQLFWDYLCPEDKVKVKNGILSTLMSTSNDVMKAGANAIAVIAAVQIPRNEWAQLVQILAESTTHDSIAIRNASITTLGFICQQIKFSGKMINERCCQQILGAIIIATRQKDNLQIKRTSIQALRNSIMFLKNFLKTKKYRDQVFLVFLNQIRGNTPLVRVSYQALFQFCKACYEDLGDYYDEFILFSTAHIHERNENTVLALELWDTIGMQYRDRMEQGQGRINSGSLQINNYLQVASEKLLFQIFACLLINSKEDLDFPQMRESTVKTVTTFVLCCNRSVVDKITEAISVLISSQKAGQKQASALLFSTLCEYSDKGYIETCFMNGFDHFYGLLFDQHLIVRKNTLNGFVRMAEAFPRVFLRHQNVNEIINKFYQLIQQSDLDLRLLALHVLIEITQSLKEQVSVLTTKPEVLLTKIVGLFASTMLKNNQECKEANEKLVMIIMNIVLNCKIKNVIMDLVEFLIKKYYDVSALRVQDLQTLLQGILTILHTCIIALKDNMPASEENMKSICALINDHIKKFGVQPEGLNLISAVAVTFNRMFMSRSDQFWKYIEHGLQMVEQKNTFKASLAACGDYARIFESGFGSKAQQILKNLINCMQTSPNLDRECQRSILLCMGDLMLSMKEYGQVFLDSLITITDWCMQIVYNLSNNENQIQYVEELKETIIDMYGCAVFAVNGEKGPNHKLYQHFPAMAIFIVRTCNVSLHPKLEYLKMAIFLLYDEAGFFWQNQRYRSKVTQILKSQQVNEIVDSLFKFKNKPDIADLLNYISHRKSIL